MALRFSKTGARPIEETYARHFVLIGKKNPFEAAEGSSEANTQVSPEAFHPGSPLTRQ
jgi:hypothetical protein